MPEIEVQEAKPAPGAAQGAQNVDFQPLIQQAPGLIQKYLRFNVVGETIDTVCTFGLGALIIGCATLLALRGVIEGQAIAGFLGAAIGYIFAKNS